MTNDEWVWREMPNLRRQIGGLKFSRTLPARTGGVRINILPVPIDKVSGTVKDGAPEVGSS